MMIDKLSPRGRTSRTTLITWVVVVALSRVALAFLLTGNFGIPASPMVWNSGSDVSVFFPSLFDLVATVLLAVLQARRFHDQNRSGWLCLTPYAVLVSTYLLPALSTLGLLVMVGYFVALLLPPTIGPNRFGPDPRGWESPEHRAAQDRELGMDR